MENIDALTTKTLPVVALRGLVVFPYMVLHFDVGRDISINALKAAMDLNQEVFLVAQKDLRVEKPGYDDLFTVGTISKIKQILKMPGDTYRVLVEGKKRAAIVEPLEGKDYFIAQVETKDYDKILDDITQEAYLRNLLEIFEAYVAQNPRISPESVLAISELHDLDRACDLIAGQVVVKQNEKQMLLECLDPLERCNILCDIITKEKQILKLEKSISRKVAKKIEKTQKEYYLKEQIKVIQNELGDFDLDANEIEELKERIKLTPLSAEAREKCKKELSRMVKMAPGSPEISIIRTYIDWILSLPWGVYKSEEIDLRKAKKILEEEHYGLIKVKERILEHLAVRKLKNDMKGPILCFAGPPGVGKTSIAHSIANAMGRDFVRMSLGGVKDEAEIRGHRRTYIGAIPGRIISSIRQAKSMNPVFLLDEIDKMSSDFKGDPASAMLEVLDPEINSTFKDHYLDIDFDLSDVVFLTTANDIYNIPAPLYDRMEIIEISSYTEEEKLNIAMRHLVPKQLKEHGLTKERVAITRNAIGEVISKYTMESGVRSLERQIGAIVRKAAVKILEDNCEKITVGKKDVEKYLGKPRIHGDKIPPSDQVGVVTGLAWTAYGGQILPVEVGVLDGTGQVEMTGQLGDVMKESAKTAISFVRSMAKQFKLDADYFSKKDIHIHIPEGAIPKDGPSAGVTLVTAIASAVTETKVDRFVAMTGEVTLTGRVLAIGGLKEKTLAALRSGVKRVIIPKANKRDMEELPEVVKKSIEFKLVDRVEDVLKIALKNEKDA